MRLPNSLSRRVADHHTAAQPALTRRVNGSATAADRAVAAIWADLLAVLKTTHGPERDYHRLLRVLRRIGPAITSTLTTRLATVYQHAHAAAGRSVLTALPRTLREDEGDWADELDPLAWIRDLLIEPPKEDLLWRALSPLIVPADWELIGERHDRKLPTDLAREIANRMGQGESQYELAKALRPYLDGSRVRARRAARTFGVHIAHVAQVDAWGELGDMVIGYQIHATANTCPPSRKWHQERSGTIYYRHPKRGQKGFDKMPRPPMEAPDIRERPAGTPSIAWNCLCFLTPVMSLETAGALAMA